MQWIRARLSRGDSGVSLVEAVVAMFIATGVFMALAAATVTSLRSTLVSRQNQQASDIATQIVEKARAMTFGAMTMATADVPNLDAKLTGTSATGYVAALASGTECAAITDGGALTQHQVTLVRNKTTFTTQTYITYPGVSTSCKTASGSVRRVTVLVTWSANGKSRSRQLSSLVANTVRGLPLPRFALATQKMFTTNPGGSVAFPIRIVNQGARDSFELTVAPSSPAYTIYIDTNKNGDYDPATETATAPLSINGKPSTGLLEPGAVFWAVAYRVLGAGEVSSTLTITATSVAQPTYAGATHSITDTINISGSAPAPSPSPTATSSASPSPSPSPTGTPTPTPSPVPVAACAATCYTRSLWLHNTAAGGASTTQEVMPASLAMPTQTALPAYSGGTTGGRAIAVGSNSAGENSSGKVADWRFQIPANSQFNGTARFTLWASADASSASSSHTLTFAVGSASSNSNNNSFSQFSGATASATAVNWGTSPRQVTVDIPLSSVSITNGQYLVLRVQVASSSSGAMHLQYDTTTYGAAISLPVVNGIP